MKLNSAFRSIPLLLLTAPLAQAHPGHGRADFVAGLVHPLTGWDHLLAMVAVGLWAAQLGGRARWALPAAFVACLVVGAGAGIAGFLPAGSELWIAASVVLLGLALAGAIRLPLSAGAALAAAAGLLHGAAHGAEMPFSANSVHFLAGMVAATTLLHAAGLAAGLVIQPNRPVFLRVAGAGIAVMGVVLLA